MRQIIYRSKTLVAVFMDTKSPVVFATFNEMATKANGDHFWGDVLFERNGMAAVGFVSTAPDWYTADEMDAAIELAKDKIAGRKVVYVWLQPRWLRRPEIWP